MDQILENLNVKQKRLNEMTREKEVSNWLSAYPLKEYGFDLNKQQFWDGISTLYGWPLNNLPTKCACGSKYDFQHSMSCNKGGLVSIPHNDIRDLTAVVGNRATQDTSQKPQGKFFLSFLYTFFYIFQDLKNYELRLLRSDPGSLCFPLPSFLQYLNNYSGLSI